jgi:arginase family enzyme
LAVRQVAKRRQSLERPRGPQFVGKDLVEVSPAWDVAEITTLTGATMVWEYLCLLGDRGI